MVFLPFQLFYFVLEYKMHPDPKDPGYKDMLFEQTECGLCVVF